VKHCAECGHPFNLDYEPEDDERDVCPLCESRMVRESHPELIHDDDWCSTCHCPIGLGGCGGCCAVAAVDASSDYPVGFDDEDDGYDDD
jgi:DNA-directed RNA polymerase subunit RPC12/RpoP